MVNSLELHIPRMYSFLNVLSSIFQQYLFEFYYSEGYGLIRFFLLLLVS